MHFSNEEKAKWLEEWKQSGKSAWAYSRENGLKQQTFAKWVKQGTETKSGFVKIPAKKIPSTLNVSRVLIEKGELKIHLPVTMSSNELRTFIDVLGAVK